METIFSATCAFLLTYKGDIASKVIASATYDVLKNAIDFSTLKHRIQSYFNGEAEVNKFVEVICERSSLNSTKPERDIEDAYEDITSNKYDHALFGEIKSWIEDNEDILTQISKMEFSNNHGFNIGVQNAKKNIINIAGDYKPKKE